MILVNDSIKIPAWFKALSSFYYERFAFGYVNFGDEQKLAKKRLKVKTAPQLIVFLEDDTRVDYDGFYHYEAIE